MQTPVLGFPDVNKEFILDTDASFDTVGEVLLQRDDNGREKVIAYGSHAMRNHEKLSDLLLIEKASDLAKSLGYNDDDINYTPRRGI